MSSYKKLSRLNFLPSVFTRSFAEKPATMKKLIFFLFISSVLSYGCDVFDKRIRGDGNIKTETRSVSQFNGISVSGAIDAYVRHDSVSSVKVEAEENLLELIEVNNQGGTLHIHERNGYNLRPTRDIKVYVAGPEFRNFRASGACDIYSENKLISPETIDIHISGASSVKLDLNAPSVNAGLSGACSVDLRGQTKNVELDGSGASKFLCFDLLAENVSVEISGAGEAQVFASVKLDVRVSGAGTVHYKGNASVNQRVSGAGSVNKVD